MNERISGGIRKVIGAHTRMSREMGEELSPKSRAKQLLAVVKFFMQQRVAKNEKKFLVIPFQQDEMPKIRAFLRIIG